MKIINSKQKNVPFAFCPSPITIDKRGDWGDSPENFQKGPHGAYLKFSSETEISHLVQPNADGTAPEGWIVGDKPGLFHKCPIWIDEIVLEAGMTKKVPSLDNTDGMIYDIKEPSIVCYNDRDGKPNLQDAWVQSVVQIKKSYEF